MRIKRTNGSAINIDGIPTNNFFGSFSNFRKKKHMGISFYFERKNTNSKNLGRIPDCNCRFIL